MLLKVGLRGRRRKSLWGWWGGGVSPTCEGRGRRRAHDGSVDGHPNCGSEAYMGGGRRGSVAFSCFLQQTTYSFAFCAVQCPVFLPLACLPLPSCSFYKLPPNMIFPAGWKEPPPSPPQFSMLPVSAEWMEWMGDGDVVGPATCTHLPGEASLRGRESSPCS